MKSLKIGLRHVNRCRLPSLGPCDYRNQWSETLNNMVQVHSLFIFPYILRSWIPHHYNHFITSYFHESCLRCLVFFITTGNVITSTMEFALTTSPLWTNGVWSLEPIYIRTKFYVETNWLTEIAGSNIETNIHLLQLWEAELAVVLSHTPTHLYKKHLVHDWVIIRIYNS